MLWKRFYRNPKMISEVEEAVGYWARCGVGAGVGSGAGFAVGIGVGVD
jgi:hypothetical protein